MGRKAAIAAVIVEVLSTIDQLLLGKIVRLVVVNEVRGLETSSRRERPARAAMSLVLDR